MELRRPTLPKARLEALTDGIFAVTMTLLVLDLRFPEHPTQSLWDDLVDMLPRIDNYVISFVVLAVFWLGHLRMLHRMREADPPFAMLNLAFLLFTTLVPPLTSLLGNNPQLPRAAILYGVNLILILGCEALAWRLVCTRLGDESAGSLAGKWPIIRSHFLLGIGVVLFAILIALVEIRLGWTQGFAPYLYLLLIGVGVVRPTSKRGRAFQD